MSPGSYNATSAWRWDTCKACARVLLIGATYVIGVTRKGTRQRIARTHLDVWYVRKPGAYLLTEWAVWPARPQRGALDSSREPVPRRPSVRGWRKWRWRRSPNPQYAVGPLATQARRPPSLYGWARRRMGKRIWRWRRFRHRRSPHWRKDPQGRRRVRRYPTRRHLHCNEESTPGAGELEPRPPRPRSAYADDGRAWF